MSALKTYRQQLKQKFGLTADYSSQNFQQGYEDGKKSSYRGTPIRSFPIETILKSDSNYAWGYYEGFLEN
jgi:hypothetical protein